MSNANLVEGKPKRKNLTTEERLTRELQAIESALQSNRIHAGKLEQKRQGFLEQVKALADRLTGLTKGN